jgi:hypothetical protein
MHRVYDELVDLIATGTTPSKLIGFEPSEPVRARVADLLHAEKTSGLSTEDASELAYYMEFEHLLRLAKARSRQHAIDE